MRVWPAALVGALLLVPVAQAQPPAGHVNYCSRECLPSQVNDGNLTNGPTNIILYAHLLDALQRAPLNTVPPDMTRERDVHGGYLTPSVRVPTGAVNFQNNVFTMYHLPAFVSYDAHANNQDGPPAYPVELVGDRATAYWYLSPHAVPGTNATTLPVGGVGAIPQLTVVARLETGRHPGFGTLIAEGASVAPVVVSLPGNDYAYEFQIPLTIRNQTIAAEDGFVLSVQWYQARNGEDEVTQSDWRIRSGIRFPNRLILPVAQPVRVLDHLSVLRDGHYFIVTTLASAFGAYDLDAFSLNMTFREGPSDVGNPQPLFFVVNPLKPQTVRVVWAVPGDASLRAGAYDFSLSVVNLQHTYELRDRVSLDILGIAGPKAGRSPDLAAPLALLTMAAAALLRRRV
ncbi:MAG: hypothetical protein HYT80_01135 [Euryarchaeota archaeon]|nr:hypothetical protein [Euryarchaeota archaeon]